jgi:hypothetical protein
MAQLRHASAACGAKKLAQRVNYSEMLFAFIGVDLTTAGSHIRTGKRS